ncbi:MAG: undecaprenyl-diphosphate phosphatase [Planctomycetia bacterium]
MDWIDALILGLVEGLTEYLPVSSTGHLLLAERLLGLEANEANHAYAIVIQAGAILAVLWACRPRVVQLLGAARGDAAGRRLVANLAVAFVPAAAIGFLLDDWIEAQLFGMWPIATMWILGGIFILLVPRLRRGGAQGLGFDEIGARQALLIGLAQVVAMAPGTSRSLATISAALLVGLSGAAAVEFSFLLGVATLTAASAWTALKSHEALAQIGLANIAIGLLVSYVAAWATVSFLLEWVRSRGLAMFGWYRLALGGLVSVGLWLGWLEAS